MVSGSPKKIFGVIPALILFAAVVAAQPPAHDKQQSLTGTVSDAMCGAKHMQEGSAADCTRVCVKGGSKYALVVGDKVYTLSYAGLGVNRLDNLAWLGFTAFGS